MSTPVCSPPLGLTTGPRVVVGTVLLVVAVGVLVVVVVAVLLVVVVGVLAVVVVAAAVVVGASHCCVLYRGQEGSEGREREREPW